MSITNPADVAAARALGRSLVVNDALFEPGTRGAIAESVARIETAQEELSRRTLRSPDRAAPSTADLAELTAIQSTFEPLFAGVFEVTAGNAAPHPSRPKPRSNTGSGYVTTFVRSRRAARTKASAELRTQARPRSMNVRPTLSATCEPA
jgi:hypothetical protein